MKKKIITTILGCLVTMFIACMCMTCTIIPDVPIEDEIIPPPTTNLIAHIHKYNEVEREESSCIAAGAVTKECSCGSKITEVLAKIPHNFKTTTVEPTCTSNGLTILECECGHKIETIIQKMDHSFITTIQSPTCTEHGFIKNECYCGETTITTIATVDHSFVEIKQDPTCINEGFIKNECSCGELVYETIPKIPHVFVITSVINATCSEFGYTISNCNLCGLENIEELPLIEHTFIKEHVDPTCTTMGYNALVCMCGERIEEQIAVIEHNYKNENKNATCTEAGCEKLICQNCGHENILKTINAMGHNYGEYIVTKEPTGFEEGSKRKTCLRCGAIYTVSIPKTDLYPIVEKGETYTITITREWYQNAWVYAAHIEFTDYTMLATDCAYGRYKAGYETTSAAAKRLGSILTINGCYSAPHLNYTVVRNGKIWNGADKNLFIPGVYSSHTGLFQNGYDTGGGTPGLTGVNVQKLVDEGKVTDTFCFGPPNLVNGINCSGNDTSRAQRTFIGTNGKPGDIWFFVSDGRKVDGESAGLTFKQTADYMISKGCTFGINLDGGGSTTMVYRGHILNAIKTERAVVDFVYFLGDK